MKLLLDECIDRRFALELEPHFVRTVPQMGWAGIKNGELLKRAEKEFDVFITVDRNLSFQQNITNIKITVIVLKSKSNRLSDLKPFATKIISALPNINKNSLITL
jgi:hypothetical protein